MSLHVGERVHHATHGEGTVDWIYRSGYGVLVKFDAEPEKVVNVPNCELVKVR